MKNPPWNSIFSQSMETTLLPTFNVLCVALAYVVPYPCRLDAGDDVHSKLSFAVQPILDSY